MRIIYRVLDEYPRSYKIIKISLLVVTLLLAQVYVSLFHSELVLQEQLKDEKAAVTQLYAFRNEEFNYPGSLTNFFYKTIDYKDYGISEVKRSRAIILSDDLFLEINKDSVIKVISGKDIQTIQGQEVAVSSAYAIQHFGNVADAVGQPIREKVERTSSAENPIYFDMVIASVYAHSGLERRYLNALTEYEYDPTGGNSVYADTIFVDENNFSQYLNQVGNIHYVEGNSIDQRFGNTSARTRYVTKYSIYYDDYSLANEAKLGADLQIQSSMYDSYYVIYQSLGNIIKASALMTSSIGFMTSFQFMTLFVLLFSIIFYLVFLQELATERNQQTMWKLGIDGSQVVKMKMLHEGLLASLGFGLWILLNTALNMIFKEQMLYIAEMFVFHWVHIIVACGITILLWLVFSFGGLVSNFKPNVSRIFHKHKNYEKLFTKQFYLRRLYAISPRRFLLMILVGILVTSSFTVLSRFEDEINTIYQQEQPLNYDFYVVLNQDNENSEQLAQLLEYVEYMLSAQPFHNNVIFTHKVVQGKTNAVKATQIDLYSDNMWEFIDIPNRPSRDELQQQMIQQNSPIILSRQLKEALGITNNQIKDFETLYGKQVSDMETGIKWWEDDLDLFVVPPNFYQQWGVLDSQAKVRVMGFDNILDNNGYVYYNLNYPGLVESLGINQTSNTPTTLYFLLKDHVDIAELKDVLVSLQDNQVITNHELGMTENIFDYTGSDSRITSVLLVVTFTLYALFLLVLIIMKDLNDQILQQKNAQAYHKLGIDHTVINKSMRQLNAMSMVVGFVIGVGIVLVMMPLIRYFLYEVLVLFH